MRLRFVPKKCDNIIYLPAATYTIIYTHISNEENYRFDEASPPVSGCPSLQVLQQQSDYPRTFSNAYIAFSLVFGLNGLVPRGGLLLPFAINLCRRSRCLYEIWVVTIVMYQTCVRNPNDTFR